MILLPLVVLFVVVPIAEIYVIIQVGQAIGAVATIGLLVLDSIVGSALLRAQGRVTWRRFQDALSAGRPPAREVLDGALVIFGGALLLSPGFVTDALGLVLLLPPTRAIVRRLLVRHLGSRILMRAVGGRRPPGRAYDVDGSGIDVHPPTRTRLP